MWRTIGNPPLMPRFLASAFVVLVATLLALAALHAGPAQAQSTIVPSGPTVLALDQSGTFTCTATSAHTYIQVVATRDNGQETTTSFTTSPGGSVSLSISWSESGEKTVGCRSLTNIQGFVGTLTVSVGATGPLATIAAGDGITEGGNAVFTITLAEAVSDSITVNVSVAQVGTWVSGTYSSVTVADNAATATLTVLTTDDGIDEANGSITATIEGGGGYRVGNPSSATLAVADNDVPAVSVAAGSSVVEGAASVFTLTASPTPYQNIIIGLTVGQTGSYVAADDLGVKSVTMTTSGTVTYSVPTVNDGLDEADGAATLTVNTGSGYAPASAPNNTASGTVTDNDVPVISVVGGASVTEGESAGFTLTASPLPYQALSLKLTVGQTGNYVAAENLGAGKTLTMPTSGTATYSVATVDDNNQEANGAVTLTVTAGTGYTEGASASVTVVDDDITRIEVSGGGAITEGADATFVFTTNPALTSPTVVSLTVSQAGSFVKAVNLGDTTHTINPSEVSSYTYTVATVNDAIHEVNGSVSVTVRDSAAYNPGTANVATVTVNDNDELAAPVVTVSTTATQSFTLAWADPPGAVGVSYTLQYRRSTVADWQTWDYAGQGRTVTGLLPDTPYVSRVQAVGQRSSSPWSELAQATTTSGPDAPTVTLADRDGGSLSVSFTTPNFRGTTVQGYAVRYRKASVSDWTDYGTTLAANARAFSLTSLTPGTAYVVQVRAIPNVGEGVWGSLNASTTSAPGAVTYLAFSSANNVSVNLIWDAPDSSGYAISRYELRYRENRSPKPAWTEVTSISPSLAPTYRVSSLNAGLAYEAQVRAVNSQGQAPWSSVLFFETNAGLFTNDPPRNVAAETLAQSQRQVVTRVTWEKVVDANDYQVSFSTDTNRVIEVTDHTHLELTYNIPPGDTGGTFRLAVRARRVVADSYNYSPWSPSVPLAYFIDRSVDADAVLVAEIGGTREASAGIMGARESLGDAITEIAEPSGFEPDTQGILDFLAMLPALFLLGVSIYGGMKFRAVGLAVGVGSVLAVISMYAGSAVLGLDVIWPMLGTFGLVFFGIQAAIRRYDIDQPYLVYAVFFLALHAAAVFAQNVAGYSLTGAADYGDSLWAGTPMDDFLAIRKLDSYFDLRALFTAMGDTLLGLFGLVVFDYAAFKGHAGAALLFVAVIKLVLSLSSSSLILTIIRQLFSTGIFNSAAGLAMVVGGVGVAAVISSVAGADTGTPRLTIVAESQGLAVEEGSAATWTLIAEPAPERPLQAVLTVEQTGSYVRAGDIGNKIITIPTDGLATYSVLTYEDNLNAAAGTVTATLNAGEGYELRDPRTATIIIAPKVVDGYQVSIWPDSQGIPADEGQPAQFRVASDPSPEEPLTVNLTVTTSGSYVLASNAGSKTVTIPTSGEAIYSVPTETVVGHVSGSVTVTLATGTDYSLIAPTSATVSVKPTLPVITVAAGTTVTEGTPAQFTFTAQPAPAANLVVRFAVEESGKYLASGQAGFKTVTIPPSGSVVYSVSTEADSDPDESDGYIDVSLAQDEANYVVGLLPNARVNVLNIDTSIPTITVSSNVASVTEGDLITFTFRAVPAPTSNLPVKVNLREEGEFITNNPGLTVTVGVAGTVNYSVRPANDNVDEPNGAITAEITPSSDNDYRVGSPGAARVTVNDND